MTANVDETGPIATCSVHRGNLGYIEKGIRQRDGIDISRQGWVNHEAHRHLLCFTTGQRLIVEAETFGLAQVARRVPRRDVGDGLTHGGIPVIGDVEHHRVQLARMDFNGRLFRRKIPGCRTIDGGHELHLHRSAQIRLDRLKRLGRDQCRASIDAQRITQGVIQRHQRVAEAEHGHHDHTQTHRMTVAACVLHPPRVTLR